MKLKLMTLALILVPMTWAHAQFKRDWLAFRDGSQHRQDYGEGLTVDATGNLYVVGVSNTGVLDGDILVMKLDRSGRVLWQRSYDGPAGGNEYAWIAALDPQGNLVVHGDSEGINSSYDMLVLKYDTDGNLLWEARYDGPASGFDASQGGISMVLDAAGRIFVTGMSYGGPATGNDCVTLAYGPDGALEWEQRYDGGIGLSDYGSGVALDAAGNVYVGGRSRGVSDDGFLALKYSPDGNLLWESRHAFAGSTWVLVYGMVTDSESNVIAHGFVVFPESQEDYGVVKWDADGNFQWARTYDGPVSGTDIPFAAAVDDLGNVVLTGVSDDYTDTASATVMYDADGNLLWSDRFQGTNHYWGGDTASASIAFDAAGAVHVAGFAYNGPPTAHDGHILEYSPDGQLLDVDLIDGPLHAEDGLAAIRFAGNGSLYGVGWGVGESFTQDVLVVKYRAPGSFGMGRMN